LKMSFFEPVLLAVCDVHTILLQNFRTPNS
jgi:hypothetical protein